VLIDLFPGQLVTVRAKGLALMRGCVGG
jgi:hypothetical protein